MNFIQSISSSKKNYIVTIAAEFVILLAGLLVYKMASNQYGNNGFSEYALCRRSVSFIFPLLMLGMGVGIPRYISIISMNNDKDKESNYFISGLIILFIMYIFCVCFLIAFRSFFAYIMFGQEKYSYMILPICIMIGGFVFHAACYSFYRGKLQMIKANTLQLINLGIAPVIAFLFAETIPMLLVISGIVNIIVTGLFFLFMFTHSLSIGTFADSLSRNIKIFKQCSKDLLIYGFQRVPGDIGIAAFFSIPAFFASHISGIIVAGYVAFGVSLLNMAGAAFGPICLIVLPEAGKIISSNNIKKLKQYSDKILKWTLILTITGVVIFEALADFIIKIYLGNGYEELVNISRVIIIGSLGYTVYISLRSILDAFFVKAINTKNIFISLIFFTFLLFIIRLIISDYWSIIYAFTLSMLLLGILTFNEVEKIFKKNDLAIPDEIKN